MLVNVNSITDTSNSTTSIGVVNNTAGGVAINKL